MIQNLFPLKENEIYTDHNALKVIIYKLDMIPRIRKWCLKLLEYDFDLVYQPEKQMQHVQSSGDEKLKSQTMK